MSDNIIKCYCPKCQLHSYHKVMAEHEYLNNDDSYLWKQIYRMVKCCGCDHVSFDIETIEESNICYDNNGIKEICPIHTSYPEREGSLNPMETSWEFPLSVLKVYKETIKAINNECYILAAAGFRAIIEAICLDKNIQAKNLEQKINKMQKEGLITLADRNRFHSVRFLGNDSVHEIKTPERRTLLVVLEIIEGIIKNLYVYDEKMSSEFISPIKTIEEFIQLLDEGLTDRSVGQVATLRNLLPENRRLIKEDLANFEKELMLLIEDGKYKKLSLCQKPATGHNQQYKIESF